MTTSVAANDKRGAANKAVFAVNESIFLIIKTPKKKRSRKNKI